MPSGRHVSDVCVPRFANFYLCRDTIPQYDLPDGTFDTAPKGSSVISTTIHHLVHPHRSVAGYSLTLTNVNKGKRLATPLLISRLATKCPSLPFNMFKEPSAHGNALTGPISRRVFNLLLERFRGLNNVPQDHIPVLRVPHHTPPQVKQQTEE